MNNKPLPTPKMERWKYSNLAAFVPQGGADKPLSVLCDIDTSFIARNNIPAVAPWAQDTYGDMGLWHGAQGILSVHIPADTHVDKPVNLSMNVAESVKSCGHITITLEKGASLTLYDDMDIDGWCNRSMTVTLADGARMNHIRTGKGPGVVTNLTQIKLAENAGYNGYSLLDYGSFVRDQIHARLEGENGECLLSGAKLLKDRQHADTTILIEHTAPHCHSNQNYRNILNDHARGVFQGKVHVHQPAQKTDGYQLCNSVLLSSRAEMDTKPELEIYADDVRCSHGATTAQPDEEPLFYLQARGIPLAQARKILLQAFVSESLEAFIDYQEVYDALGHEIAGRMDV